MKRKSLNRKKRKRFQSKRIISFLVFIAFLLLVGCEGGGSTASIPSKGTGVSPPKKPGPADVVEKKESDKKVEEEYTYIAAGKPDPFKPFIQLTPVKDLSKNVLLTPLQRYEISQLKLVAIISTPDGNVALIEDSSGKGFFLKRGTLVGKNDGKVTKVLNDKVTIEELYQDVLGQTKNTEISLHLHPPEEGAEP